ncbi:hypothetical protein A3B42_04175 [Candidatus Daviesbacteria bacterium RIFCSPLOWO2_01_FULL_38_10]|nr:MAG: hypothetical protein A3D02_02795 [Candidatus Daviesbacteria bacterium RIFCSPHIGHO2_02_FULL_39_41]OGE29843.1 MAG: hypothetical protein A2772_02930 [Candidatus Daviesbacteria bacterium RIFCSPHIGHO2_01_FULL_38_8b]OGE38808.1 MAG: hypothetical protein A3B42_04175 [Candidatus Daviesbacteria bacterium RIFCSPLOWO2_01_FULL_38_10]OGE44806.1 MAG: hypothetical protein A3E67_01635 [Candidatus Daviesbacteria bacterium RIFCSPHIGHO2_12_FULL_38_25]OGE68424.1 MAG: hypothetical protein A3H81_03960 [Candid
MEQPDKVMPQPEPVIMQVPPTPTPVKGKTMWLIVGLVVVLLIIGGIYLLQSRQKVSQSSKVSPSPVATDNLEQDLNSVDVGDLETEFDAVDQDLQSL